MIKNALGMTVSLTASLFLGFSCMVYFRKRKTGVNSPYIADGDKLSDEKKTIGLAFASLFATIIAFFGIAFAVDGEVLKSFISSGVFLTVLCFLGYKDDKELFIKENNVATKTKDRIFYTIIISLLFAVVYMVLGNDTVISLPLISSKLRLSGFYGPFVALVTLICCEGERKTGVLNNSEIIRGIIKLSAIIFVTAFMGKSNLVIIPYIYLGTLAGTLFWADFKKVFKTGFSDKYMITAMVLSACFVTENEGMLLFLFAFEILCLLGHPVDKVIHKLFGSHIFIRLPIDEHLKASGAGVKKIKIMYITITVILALLAVAVRLVLLMTE